MCPMAAGANVRGVRWGLTQYTTFIQLLVHVEQCTFPVVLSWKCMLDILMVTVCAKYGSVKCSSVCQTIFSHRAANLIKYAIQKTHSHIIFLECRAEKSLHTHHTETQDAPTEKPKHTDTRQTHAKHTPHARCTFSGKTMRLSSATFIELTFASFAAKRISPPHENCARMLATCDALMMMMCVPSVAAVPAVVRRRCAAPHALRLRFMCVHESVYRRIKFARENSVSLCVCVQT